MTQKTQTTPPKGGREGRWGHWLLIVSLGLNLLVGGLVVGAIAHDGPPGGPGRLDLSVGPLARALSEDDRHEISQSLRRDRPFDREARGAMRADFTDLQTHLRAPEFDAVAFQEVLLRQRGRMVTAQDAVYDALLERISAMPQSERISLADRLQREVRPNRDRDHNGDER